MQSEEKQRIKDTLESVDLKINSSKARNSECMTIRAEHLRKRN